MAVEKRVLSDGTYSFAETDVEGQFYFFRNDGKPLGNVSHVMIDFFRSYTWNKIAHDNQLPTTALYNFSYEISLDGKYIRITAFP